jgi:hypothetical protein
MRTVSRLLCGSALALTAAAAQASPLAGSGANTRTLLFHADVHVKANGSYTERDTQVIEALTRTGAIELNPYQQQYSSELSTLKVVSAWIGTPDGKHITIPESAIYVRPVPASRGAPMYSHAKVLNILLPNFGKGDKLHLETVSKQFKPYFPNHFFDAWDVEADQSARDQKIVVSAPASMHLRAAQRGGWQLTRETQGSEDIFTATMAVHHPRYAGPSTVDPDDYSPLFEVSNFPTWKSIGAAYWTRAKAMADVTPLVQAVADKVAGKLHGLAAAQALYAWTALHIRYVGLELGVGGFVPISATQTLKTGYGDCKAHSTLLEALFAARGIKAYPVLISWSNSFEPMPLPGLGFNHAIDYLPKYHMFLDATGEFETMGQLAIGERDKFIVVAGPHPETLRTPGAQPNSDYMKYRATLHLAADGTLTGKAAMVTHGWWAWVYREVFAEVPPAGYDRLMDTLLKPSGGGQGGFRPSNPMVLDKPFRLGAHWTTHAYALPGKTLTVALPAGPYFVPAMTRTAANPLNGLSTVIGPVRRKHPVYTYLGHIDWTSKLTIPRHYVATWTPRDVTVHNTAGSFSFRLTVHGDLVTAHYDLNLAHVLYTPAQYAALRTLLLTDLRIQRAPLVFTRT